MPVEDRAALVLSGAVDPVTVLFGLVVIIVGGCPLRHSRTVGDLMFRYHSEASRRRSGMVLDERGRYPLVRAIGAFFVFGGILVLIGGLAGAHGHWG